MKRSFLRTHPSTRAFFREGKKTRNFSFFDAIHGYIYGRWIYLYISIGTGEHPLAKLFYSAVGVFNLLGKIVQKEKKTTFADTYHDKVVTLDGPDNW